MFLLFVGLIRRHHRFGGTDIVFPYKEKIWGAVQFKFIFFILALCCWLQKNFLILPYSLFCFRTFNNFTLSKCKGSNPKQSEHSNSILIHISDKIGRRAQHGPVTHTMHFSFMVCDTLMINYVNLLTRRDFGCV